MKNKKYTVRGYDPNAVLNIKNFQKEQHKVYISINGEFTKTLDEVFFTGKKEAENIASYLNGKHTQSAFSVTTDFIKIW